MRALPKGVNKGRCFAMKMIYEAPAMYAEAFAPNQYVAACKDPVFENDVPPMTVRCQSEGHMNIAATNIFFDERCTGKYDANAADSGYVQGVWDTGKTFWGYGDDVDWFYEDTNGNGVIDNDEYGGQTPKDTVLDNIVTAFKGWFNTWQGSHLFYARAEQVAQYNVS